MRREFRSGRVLALLLLWLGCGAAARAQEKSVDLSVDQSRVVSFAPPAGFRALDEKQVAAMNARGVPGKFMFTDAQLESSIVVNAFGDDATEEGLAEVRKAIEAKAKQDYARVEWYERGPVRLKGQKWMRLRYKGTPRPEDGEAMVDDFYFVEWAGSYLLFTFSCPASKYAAYKAAFERSARTIELSISVIAPAEEPKPSETKPPETKPAAAEPPQRPAATRRP